uniref:Uncharacterized protein n=1 Tax=Rhizophora mucronata TaxID=61149 RepID=A0A2P2N179_RHIMU
MRTRIRSQFQKFPLYFNPPFSFSASMTEAAIRSNIPGIRLS